MRSGRTGSGEALLRPGVADITFISTAAGFLYLAVVLDADAAPGGAWQHRWASLRLERANGIADLPGMALEGDPGERASVAMARYFGAYEQHFALPVRRPVALS